MPRPPRRHLLVCCCSLFLSFLWGGHCVSRDQSPERQNTLEQGLSSKPCLTAKGVLLGSAACSWLICGRFVHTELAFAFLCSSLLDSPIISPKVLSQMQ